MRLPCKTPSTRPKRSVTLLQHKDDTRLFLALVLVLALVSLSSVFVCLSICLSLPVSPVLSLSRAENPLAFAHVWAGRTLLR